MFTSGQTLHSLLVLLASAAVSKSEVVYDLRFYGLTNLDNITQMAFDNATRIDLAQNELTTIKNNTFKTFINLDSLTLNINKISSIEPLAFANTVLTFISLEDNLLPSFPNLTPVAKTLTLLRLGKNQITQIPSGSFAEMSVLNTLEMNDNLLTACPDFSSMPTNNRLKTLVLSKNKITSVHQDCFTPLIRVKVIEMRLNDLKGTPDLIFPPSMVQLSISDNPSLTSFRDDAFISTTTAKLDMTNCNISIPFSLSGVGTSLSTLILTGNPLNLMETHMLGEFFRDLKALTSLTLVNTGITTLPDIRSYVPSLTALKMNSVPLDCNCDIAWLVKAEAAGLALTLDDPPCKSPPTLASETWAMASVALNQCIGRLTLISFNVFSHLKALLLFQKQH